jgi:hypothetical protein
VGLHAPYSFQVRSVAVAVWNLYTSSTSGLYFTRRMPGAAGGRMERCGWGPGSFPGRGMHSRAISAERQKADLTIDLPNVHVGSNCDLRIMRQRLTSGPPKKQTEFETPALRRMLVGLSSRGDRPWKPISPKRLQPRQKAALKTGQLNPLATKRQWLFKPRPDRPHRRGRAHPVLPKPPQAPCACARWHSDRAPPDQERGSAPWFVR